jgi:hypothetical protein
MKWKKVSLQQSYEFMQNKLDRSVPFDKLASIRLFEFGYPPELNIKHQGSEYRFYFEDNSAMVWDIDANPPRFWIGER